MKLRKVILSVFLIPAVFLVQGLFPASALAEEKSGSKKAKWSVERPPGETRKVNFDVDEGTWISVDVHPDGKEIVFDLLGDIYLLPLSGGKARPITSGMAWDMQPRFSPNGKWITFTSDRNGGDNIWVMNRDGSDPKAITNETFRLLNSPSWTPDSQFIVARKHFTSRRSLGAGEIWMYHLDGGEGVQVTKRPNDQKDLGEPSLSPDGEHLYYSQDVTPGKVFEYDKDSNGKIYAIQRLTLGDGRVEEWIGGPGGAIRPSPSPDGEHMAFIRRVRGQSVLMVQEMKSGREWPVYDQMDRDLQETWAIHGVYPGISWTPDAKEIVFWAQGKLHRVNVKTRKSTSIPFKVTDNREIIEPLRFPVEVHPERTQVRIPRWMQISPNGKFVVFQAMGMLYIQRINGGKPTRLTRNRSHFEFYPAWSRDSRHIVYSTWNDENLGEIRIQSVQGNENRKLTREPGHYVEPVFSPDGKTVLFRKAKGGHLVSPQWSRYAGIYKVSTAGGKARQITRDGTKPHFSNSNTFFYRTTRGKNGPQLVRHSLLTSEETILFKSKHATRLTVSPDNQSVAFAENYQAYIFPMTQTGKAISIGPKMKHLPVKKVSSRSAAQLHWAGDSKNIYWSEGPSLMEANVNFQSSDTSSGKEQKIFSLSLSFTSDMPTGKIALVGGQIVSMRGDEVIQNGVVLIEDNRITKVGSRDAISIPNGAWTLDCTDKTIIPGLIDVHAHNGQAWNGMTPQQNWENMAMLAFGVTTTHDPSNNTETVFAAAEMARTGRLLAPRLFSTGTILYGATASITAKINSLKDALAHVRRLKAVGAISVKSYNQPRRDQRQQVIEAGRQTEMMVVPEGGALFHHNMTQIIDGHTGIEHALPIAVMYDDVLQLWSATPVGYTPTLGVAYGGLGGSNYWLQESDVWDHPLLSRFVPQNVLDPATRRVLKAPMSEWNHIQAAAGATALVRAGGKAQMGAHGEREGLAAHWEMWMLHQGGMTPLEALRAATIDGAFYLGMDKDIGSIEPGKLADMVIIDGDPLTDIRISDKVTHTILNGRVYDAKTLNELGHHPSKREPMFFELKP